MFWRQNVDKFEEKDFQILRVLIKLVEQSREVGGALAGGLFQRGGAHGGRTWGAHSGGALGVRDWEAHMGSWRGAGYRWAGCAVLCMG